MEVSADPAWMTAVALMALRLGPLFVLAPVLGSADIPVRVRVLLVLALSLLLVALHPPRLESMPLAVGGFVVAAMGELVIGAAFAFGLMCVFGALQFGGRLLDIQIGFGVATLFDPATRAAAPLLGTALNLLALVVFLSIDGHHAIVRAVADSLERVPLGAGARIDAATLVGQFGAMLGLGLALVMPAVAALLLLDLAMAVVARTMPQMNIFIVAMPLKVVVGLLMLGLSLPHLAPVLQRLFGSLGPYWRSVAG